ncbi:indolepyruvate ferredoxin oxidoreductase family protein [Meridianimarinicoccus roseus]|uniref:Indolepyruvate ferredoxin oxidoreductase family protein n=1 Tax=Meridianimarinicoccus roseus TaxID=2072018 RepID=A0A2V2LGR3_9RHOB|nr:indolepyruvate ferredoxin oxidoreductase family protein [Meridianimarinicoccus roseus]PWR03141.1 indolepyruvate ferredoxin oxidoreductase family protein [Meridianimarinicoccus roseus]
MQHSDFRLSDRFDLARDEVLLNGTQALVRLMLLQAARDRAAGHATAGYVTGYRGSPLGAVDQQMARAHDVLSAADVVFQPGLNEDLAATAMWGSQQAGLRGEGRGDGVFGLWYGKGPGVDRSGDVMRHANMAGTAPLGGVLMAMGDDHTGESSTTCHQSDWALVDAHMPVLSPAGVQEILDYGIYGWGLSRFAGVWAGLKMVKDTAEVTAVVDGRADRMQLVVPEFDMPEGGLNIRLDDHWVAQEQRLVRYKRYAAEAFARANRIDRRVWGRPGAKIGFVAAGKSWLDLVHALSLLGIDAAEAERLGLTIYKVGQVWPLDMESLHDWAEGLDLIVVVEEKRKLIEVQIKEAIFDDRRGRRVHGGFKDGAPLFAADYALDPVTIAVRLGEILTEEGRATEAIAAALERQRAALAAEAQPDLAARLPYFCAGCPHNSSTVVPDGSRAYAGIGCHIMALWMDRSTSGFTHMGGEGANWIGEAPFSKRRHVFQNMGDGTYNHSGVQAIRAALMAGTTITYKILFNDAVAMTGGQKNDGGLTPEQIARELAAMGVQRIAVVHDEKEPVDRAALPDRASVHPRESLAEVQREMAQVVGVSAIIFVQTCAAEKRRRRKRKAFDDPDQRLFIDPAVCEGCGDCGVQSNCVALVPIETAMGRKRAIDQSACNKDYSCLKGFCPSFVTVTGGTPRRAATRALDLPDDLPAPALPTIRGTHNIVVTGVGGTGVVTIGAILATAAHLDGRAAAMMEMAGLAQKGGAVHIHCRIADRPEAISAVRVATAEADALIGGDLVVSAGQKTLTLLDGVRTGAVCNTHETVTGAFTRDPEFRLPGDGLRGAITGLLGGRALMLDATVLSERLLGDSIYSNMVLLGAAWQRGLIPLGPKALRNAIELNGAAVEPNLRAFDLGRWAAHDPSAVQALTKVPQDSPLDLDGKIDLWAAHLTAYQSARLARRFRQMVDPIDDAELREAVAFSYQKLLSYKDEYEVARLLQDTRGRIEAQIDGAARLTFHLAPPVLSKTGADGRPKKRAFSEKAVSAMGFLAKLKFLRGTALDPFGYSAERRMERRLITEFEADMAGLLSRVTPDNRSVFLQLARLPRKIRGFGPVKRAAVEAAAAERAALWDAFEAMSVPQARHAAE